MNYINIIFVSLFILISLSIYLVYYSDFFKTLKENFYSESCYNIQSLEGTRNCFRNFLNGLENTSQQNSSEISILKKQMSDINNNMNQIKVNVEQTSKLLKEKQNDILTKTNNTTEKLKKAQEAKDKAVKNSKKYQ